ncbi:MAG: transcription elongation factor GreA [Anaerolineales bacterium]|jgi:transcription elongation factor GreA
MSEETLLTPDGARRLKEELENLKGPARLALAQRLRSAVQQGDLSENADYASAKEAQSFLEGRIQELEGILRHARIIQPSPGPKEAIELGCRVTVAEMDAGPETFVLVGSKEADPRAGRISHESPIGSALLGHRVGELVQVQTPAGILQLKILRIE